MVKGCACASFDPDDGHWSCSISGDGCMYLIPDSKRCAEEYGEGPNAVTERGNRMSQLKKPLGIIPHRIWVDQRLQDILDAMERYTEAGEVIPYEWLLEYRKLMSLNLLEEGQNEKK